MTDVGLNHRGRQVSGNLKRKHGAEVYTKTVSSIAIHIYTYTNIVYRLWVSHNYLLILKGDGIYMRWFSSYYIIVSN